MPRNACSRKHPPADDAPAFHGVIALPGPLVVTAPTTVTRGTDVRLEWTPVVADRVLVLVSMDGIGSIALCEVPGTETSLSVASAFFDAARPGANVRVAVTASNVLVEDDGTSWVELAVGQRASPADAVVR